jgi:hypothetical protein
MLFYMADSFHSARTPKLRLAHLKQPAPTLSPSLGGSRYFNPQPVSLLRGSCAFQAFFRGALLALRFRFEKYAQHTFSTKTERRKTSGSSQSLASLLAANRTN